MLYYGQIRLNKGAGIMRKAAPGFVFIPAFRCRLFYLQLHNKSPILCVVYKVTTKCKRRCYEKVFIVIFADLQCFGISRQ